MTSQHFTTSDKFWEFPKLRPDSWQDCRTFTAQNTNYHFRTTVKYSGFGFSTGFSSFHIFVTFFVLQSSNQLSLALFLNQETETFVYISRNLSLRKQKSLSFDKFSFHWRRNFDRRRLDNFISKAKKKGQSSPFPPIFRKSFTHTLAKDFLWLVYHYDETHDYGISL